MSKDETTNHYRFKCPVKKAAVDIGHCEAVHEKTMKGKPGTCEDKLCAVASLSWKCPFRCAVRYMGEWTKKGSEYPRWDKPREDAANLPPKVLSEALNNHPPKDHHYRRAEAEVDSFATVFRDMTPAFQPRPSAGPAEKVARPTGKGDGVARKGSRGSKAKTPAPAAQVEQTAPETPDDNRFLNSQDALAGALTRAAEGGALLAAERDDATQPPETPTKTKRAQGRASRPDERTADQPLSLAERAKLMKERKAG